MTKPNELTPDQVRAIRASDEENTVLAARYGLMPAMVSRIRNRQIRKDIKDMADMQEPAVEGAEAAPQAKPELTERQHLELLAKRLGVAVDPGWNDAVLKQQVADMQILMRGKNNLAGADVTYTGLGPEDAMVKIACAVNNVHLGDGQKLLRWQTAWVPPQLAARLDGPCVSPEVAETLQRTEAERARYE